MTHPVSIRESLAAKYLLAVHDAEASPQEIEEAVAWVEASAENQEAFQRAQRFWALCGEAAQPGTAAAHRHKPRRIWAPRLAAAGLALLVGGAVALGALQLSETRRRPMSMASASHAYNTTVGEIRALRLSDGSQVTLSGATSVSFRETAGQRQLILTDGEAIFDVAKDPARPFVVYTGSGSVTALGTRFDVRHDVGGVTVTLARGSVKVDTGSGRQGSNLVLRPGSQITYTPGGQMGAVRQVNVEGELSWKDGSLYFVAEPLHAVVFVLNRYSKKPIVIDNPEVSDIPISGIAKVDGISDWLRGVASVTGIRLVENDTLIRLTSDAATRREASADKPQNP
jgi:transmembrane sensor